MNSKIALDNYEQEYYDLRQVSSAPFFYKGYDMQNWITWAIVFVIIGATLCARIRHAVRGWKWQQENPEAAWKNWQNGG